MKGPLKILHFLSYRLPKSCKEAHLIPACKFFHYPKCYHKFRMRIFNTKISSAHHHQLRARNWFCNFRGCKNNVHHPHLLQDISLQHISSWIHIQINGFKKLQNIRKHTRFSKPENHKRHPVKFDADYAGPCATLGNFSHSSSTSLCCQPFIQITASLLHIQ